MPYSYPIEEPASKHDVESPLSLSPEDSLQHATELHLSTTSSFFHALQEPPANVKPFAFVYSYNDAPKERLSRKLSIVGFADFSMPVVRRLVSDDEDVVPDCLHRSTLGVRRGDKDHMKRLEPKHKKNSSSFAQFMQQLRKDNMVAILAKDKLERFGMIKPIDPIGSDEYNKEDFFCSCFVGNISEVKRYLMGDLASSSSKSSAKTKSEESSDVPMWQPSSPQDSGDLWQPPTSGNDSSNAGGLWQPPDAEGTDGGGDAFSWQPPDSGNAYSYDNNNPSGSGWDNSETTGNQDLKRKRESEEDEEEEFHADTGAAAADAFYSGLTRNLDTRADSQLYHMRAFNGWVKATQIQELDPKTKGSGKKMGGPLRILDLACGKGGDLGKWILHSRGIKDYVGSDVARGSLKDAAIRARGMRHRGLKQCTFTCADLGHDVPGRLRSPKQKLMQKLLTWSLQGEPEHTSAPPEFKMERGGGINPNQMFDVVSIQFAIHYMMSSQKRARRFFHTVSQLLEVGGNLIATTIDARVVIGHLMNLGADLHFHDNDNLNGREPLEIKVGGGACRIRFEPEIVAKIFKSKAQSNGISEDLFGLEYTFTLVEGADHGAGVGDAVNLPEWLTPLPVLESLGKEVGLELEYVQNFHEFFKNRKDPGENAAAHSSLYSMKVLNYNGSISQDEWDISRLYCAVKFRKVREPQTEWEDDEEMPDEDEDDEDDKTFEVDPAIKMKLMPRAMLNAKKMAGEGAWKTMGAIEKTRLLDSELRKLAKAT